MTLKDFEEKVIKEQYGRDATPKLIADKSIEGLLAANCPKGKPKSLLVAWRMLVP